MKNPAKRRSMIIRAILCLVIISLTVLALTNPTVSDFKSYTKSIGFNSDYKARKSNYFIFSTYQCGDYSYLGIFKKFILTRSPFGNDRAREGNSAALLFLGSGQRLF